MKQNAKNSALYKPILMKTEYAFNAFTHAKLVHPDFSVNHVNVDSLTMANV